MVRSCIKAVARGEVVICSAFAHRGSEAVQWDDLRYVLAVADTGLLTAAARSLGVNHTTVLRRVAAFETRLGLRLFERLPTGYALTAGGEELIAAARRIDETVTELERKLAGRDLRPSGTVRVTTTNTLMGFILPEIIAEFRKTHPDIQLEIAVTNLMLKLTKRDADVAIRPAKDPPETLIGRRVAKIAFAIYGSPSYLAKRKAGRLADHRWIGPDDSLAATSVARWMRAELPECEITLRADSLLAACQAAQAGLGLAALPCYLGDTAPELVCVHRPIPEMETALWILTHADLRHTARIRAFTEFAAGALARLQNCRWAGARAEEEAARPDAMGSGLALRFVALVVDDELAAQHIERLVLARVGVQRRAGARRHLGFPQREGAARLCGGRLVGMDDAEHVGRRAGAGTAHKRWKDAHHRSPCRERSGAPDMRLSHPAGEPEVCGPLARIARRSATNPLHGMATSGCGA